MVIALHARVQLVPPSLQVIAALITHKKDLKYVVMLLEDRCYMGHSYPQLAVCDYSKVKVASANISHGLTVTYTETMHHDGRRGLVWVNELSCHPLCSFLDRICQGNLSTYDWLEKIEKKHRTWLDKMPAV